MQIKTHGGKHRISKGQTVRDLVYAKVFFKPRQGTGGIRTVKTPKWGDEALEILRTIRQDFKARGIANFCVGQKGAEFYKCLRDKAQANLDYAGKSGLWYALDVLVDKKGWDEGKVLHYLQTRFRFAPYPDTAGQNGHRILRYAAFTNMTDLNKIVEQALYIHTDLFSPVPEGFKHRDVLEAARRNATADWILNAANSAINFGNELINNPLTPPDIASAIENAINNKLVNTETIENAIIAVLEAKGYNFQRPARAAA